MLSEDVMKNALQTYLDGFNQKDAALIISLFDEIYEESQKLDT